MQRDLLGKKLGIVVAPTDACNMNCIYCYNKVRKNNSKNKISDALLEKLFQITIPYFSELTFIWHGGEPLCMGKEFFEKILSFQKEINKNGCKINNNIQSNLTLLTEDLAEFFVENRFRVGSSFDGVSNELTRHNSEQILAGLKLMDEFGQKTGIIEVVTRINIEHLIDDYEFYKEKDINYTLNPYFSDESDKDLEVPKDIYVKYLNHMFDHYFFDTHGKISVKCFDDIMRYVLFRRKSRCSYTSCLGKWVGIRPNGDIYPCNRIYSEDYCYGNIMHYDNIKEAFQSAGFERLAQEAVKRRYSCQECEIYEFCEGGCNNDALMGGEVCTANADMCYIIKGIYKHIDEVINKYKEALETGENYINPVILKNIKANRR